MVGIRMVDFRDRFTLRGIDRNLGVFEAKT